MTPFLSRSRSPGDVARRSSVPTRSAAAGFTLVELLVIVVLVGILAAVGLPNIARTSRSLRIEGSAQALVGELNRARSQAIKNNATVAVALTGSGQYRVAGGATRRLDDDVEFDETSPDSVRFTAFGTIESGRAVYTLRIGDLERRVVLDAAGQARVE